MSHLHFAILSPPTLPRPPHAAHTITNKSPLQNFSAPQRFCPRFIWVARFTNNRAVPPRPSSNWITIFTSFSRKVFDSGIFTALPARSSTQGSFQALSARSSTQGSSQLLPMCGILSYVWNMTPYMKCLMLHAWWLLMLSSLALILEF